MMPSSNAPSAARRYPLYVVGDAWGTGKTSLRDARLTLGLLQVYS